ncbi:MAG TPA: PAS domain S-box protein [Desulfatiglandales bacterium]|nr:PAS domain S-box protein [Desulfatiglandales bacterium]
MGKKLTYEELEQKIKELEKNAAERQKVEQALRESEKRLSEIVQGSLIPTFVIDNRHIITHCNKAYEKLKGISATEMIGTQKQWTTFYSQARPTIADLVVDGASQEEIARHYGGKSRKSALIEGAYEAEDFFPAVGEQGEWLYFGAAPLRDAEGTITGAIETIQDVTERKAAELALRKSERRYRTLLDFVPYPLVMFKRDGRVSYLNPEFTTVFGWTFEELEGRIIPFIPEDLKHEMAENIRRLFEQKVFEHQETKRLTKDGRVLDVSIKVAFYPESKEEESEVILILRDITQEKRMAATNEAMLRISMTLPQYPNLEDLLDHVSSEIKQVLHVEGAIVILLDEETKELFFLGTAYEDRATEKRAKEIRYPADRGISGKVIKTGQPIIVPDTSKEPAFYGLIDEKVGFQSRAMLDVPLRSGDRIIGVLCAINKKEGVFDQTDIDLLSMIGGTVALSIENARFSEDLKKSYQEVASLNRAKDKAIDHLSHELKTPIAVLFGALNILTRKLEAGPYETWVPIMEMAHRNLERINEIQYEAEDIMEDKHSRTYGIFSLLLDECADELAVLAADEVGKISIVERIRNRIEELFGPKEMVPQEILLDEFVKQRLELMKPSFSHRKVEIVNYLESTPPAYMPPEPLQKVVDGLVKNAIENTPDEGMIEVIVHQKGKGSELVVHDYGVGIVEEDRKRIFEGFFATQETMDYSSKRPFDFNAGGKGADLLRMKIFSERYNFKIDMTSSRCRFIPEISDICPGRIGECAFCKGKEDCYSSGGTTFSLYFPPAPEGDGSLLVDRPE